MSIGNARLYRCVFSNHERKAYGRMWNAYTVNINKSYLRIVSILTNSPKCTSTYAGESYSEETNQGQVGKILKTVGGNKFFLAPKYRSCSSGYCDIWKDDVIPPRSRCEPEKFGIEHWLNKLPWCLNIDPISLVFGYTAQ